MLRIFASVVFVFLVPAMALAGSAWAHAHRLSRWARHIIFDTVPEPKPPTRGPRLWQKEVDDEDWI